MNNLKKENPDFDFSNGMYIPNIKVTWRGAKGFLKQDQEKGKNLLKNSEIQGCIKGFKSEFD